MYICTSMYIYIYRVNPRYLVPVLRPKGVGVNPPPLSVASSALGGIEAPLGSSSPNRVSHS